jgi:hypothetical protein
VQRQPGDDLQRKEGRLEMTSIVSMFNASATSINVVVNNGTQFTIYAASPALNWYPVSPAKQPAFSGNVPVKGAFGYGNNQCAITPASGGSTNTLTITIPNTINPSDAVQLYLFYEDDSHVTWVLLDNGRAVDGSLDLTSGIPSA